MKNVVKLPFHLKFTMLNMFNQNVGKSCFEMVEHILKKFVNEATVISVSYGYFIEP